MDGAPGARVGGSWDILVLGMGKGGPRSAKRCLVLMLSPAQQKSLPPPLCSPQWSAASPFPPQRVWLLLALISCALSPSPCHHSLHIPPPSMHHTARLPMPQRLRPTSLLHKCACKCSHASQLISLILCASLCSPFQRAVSHPKMFAPLCPQCGYNQRGGMETSRPAQSPGTGARLFLMAMAAVVPRCLLAAPSPPKKYPSLSRWQYPWEELQKQVLGNTLQSYEWKPARWVPMAVAGDCSVQGPSWHVCAAGTQHTCAHGVPWGEHIPVDTVRAPAEQRVRARPHVPSCAHHANTDAHARLCGCTCTLCWHTTALPACACVRGQSQALLCWHAGFRAPGSQCAHAIHSLGMLELASCRRVCFLYLPVTGRASGASLQFVQVIIRVVTKSGMSEQLSSRGARPERTRTHARGQPGTGAVDTVAGRAHLQRWSAQVHTSTALHMCGSHTDIPVWWVCLASWLTMANAESRCGSCPTAVPYSRFPVPGYQHSVREDPAAGSHAANPVLSQAPARGSHQK